MNILNQYSYLLISSAIILASIFVLRHYVESRRVIAVTVASLIVLSLTGLFLLRPGDSDVNDTETARAMIANGKPTFLEFFSNYCAGCLAIRPVVDEYTERLTGTFNILRIDIHTEVGRALREQFRFSFTPEFILFNANGEEVWRGHTPPPEEQLSQITSQAIGSS